MSEATGDGQQPDLFLDRWTNDEIPIEMGPECTQPPQPLTGKRLESLRAYRAYLARHDPAFRAELERAGIHLTPEELGETEPPASGQAETAPS